MQVKKIVELSLFLIIAVSVSATFLAGIGYFAYHRIKGSHQEMVQRQAEREALDAERQAQSQAAWEKEKRQWQELGADISQVWTDYRAKPIGLQITWAFCWLVGLTVLFRYALVMLRAFKGKASLEKPYWHCAKLILSGAGTWLIVAILSLFSPPEYLLPLVALGALFLAAGVALLVSVPLNKIQAARNQLELGLTKKVQPSAAN